MMFGAEVMSDEAIIGAVVVVVSWAWPYLVDLVSTPETEKTTKRAASKVYSVLMGSGVVWAQAWLSDNTETDLRAWLERGAVLLAAIFGTQALTHAGHKMTEGTPARVAALNTFVTASSLEELAPGDRIPRKLRKELEQKKADQYARWLAENEIPPIPEPPASTGSHVKTLMAQPEYLKALRAQVEKDAAEAIRPEG